MLIAYIFVASDTHICQALNASHNSMYFYQVSPFFFALNAALTLRQSHITHNIVIIIPRHFTENSFEIHMAKLRSSPLTHVFEKKYE